MCPVKTLHAQKQALTCVRSCRQQMALHGRSLYQINFTAGLKNHEYAIYEHG